MTSPPPPDLRATGARLALLLHLTQVVFYAQAAASLLGRGYARRADFTSFYTGWSLVADGLGPRLYDFALQQQRQVAIAGEPIAEGGLLPFLNPPHLVLPLVPLAWLPRPAAFALWTLLQIVLTAVAVRRLQAIGALATPLARALAVTALVASPPMFHGLFLGAFSLWVLVCLCQMHDDLRAGRDARAGLWLAAAAIKPQMVVLVPFLLLGRRRWRALGSAAAATAALALVSLPVLGWRIWPSYLAALADVSRLAGSWGIRPDLMYNLKGSLWVVVGQRLDVINAVCLAALAAAAVGTVVAARLSPGGSALTPDPSPAPWRGERPRTASPALSAPSALPLSTELERGPGGEGGAAGEGGQPPPGEDSLDVGLALTLLAGLFFTPHLHPQDGVLLALPLAMGWSRAARVPRLRTASAALILATPVLLWVTEFTPLSDVRWLRMPTLLLGAIAAWLVHLSREPAGGRSAGA